MESLLALVSWQITPHSSTTESERRTSVSLHAVAARRTCSSNERTEATSSALALSETGEEGTAGEKGAGEEAAVAEAVPLDEELALIVAAQAGARRPDECAGGVALTQKQHTSASANEGDKQPNVARCRRGETAATCSHESLQFAGDRGATEWTEGNLLSALHA